jgi:hypothetical protein
MLLEHARRWTRAHTLRRVAEGVGASVLAGTGLAGLVAITGAPVWAIALAPLPAVAASAWWTWRRVLSIDAFVRRLDAESKHHELLTSALAAEEIAFDTPLTQVVLARAERALPELKPNRVGPLRLPRAAAALGLVGAICVGLHQAQEPLADALETVGLREAQAAPVVDPPLPEHVRADLERERQRLEELSHIPHLAPDVAETLQAAHDALAQAADAGTPGQQAMGALSRAEQALEQLDDQADEPGFFEPSALADVSDEALGEALAQAIQDGDTDALEALGNELMRRLTELPVGGGAIGDLGEGLAAGLDDLPKGADPTMSAEELAAMGLTPDQARDLADLAQASQDAQVGQRGDAKASASKLTKRTGKRTSGRGRAAQDLQASLDTVRQAREGGAGRPQGESPGEQGGPGESAPAGMAPGESAGQPGFVMNVDAQTSGTPQAGKPGGVGQDGSGAGLAGSEDAGMTGDAAETWVSGQWAGNPRELLEQIEGQAQGPTGAADPEWDVIHRGYSALSEASLRQGDVPLTRRAYVRAYFQEIRETP